MQYLRKIYARLHLNPGALKIAGIYLLTAASWILISDSLMAKQVSSSSLLYTISVLKGWLFVLVTATLLYWLVHRETAATQDRETQLRLVLTQREQAETEREQLLVENRRQKAILDAIFEADPSGLAVVVGPELQFVQVNPAYRYLTPDPQLDPVGQPYDRVWPQKSRYNQRDHFREVLRTGQPFLATGIEHHFQDGSMRSFTVQARRMAWENQQAVLLTLWDTTDLQRSERELRTSESRSKSAQELAHVGCWELDLINNRLTWSDEIYRIFGLAPQEFGATYEAFLDAIHPEDRAAVDAAYSRSLRLGKDGYEIEHRVVRKPTGELRFVHEKCDHIRDENGRVIRSVGMVQDITETKRIERALRESEQKFLSIFQVSPFGISLSTLVDGRIIDVNQAALDLFGYSREEVIGRTSVELNVYPDQAARERMVIELRQCGKLRNFERMYQTPQGETRNLAMNVDLITLAGQQYLLTTIENITERLQTEARIGQLNQELTQRNIEVEIERERWKGVLEGIADEVWVCDAEGKITLMNVASQTAMGLEEFKDLTVLEVLEMVDILTPDGQPRPPEQAPLLRSLGGEIVVGEEIMRYHKTGRTRYRQYSSAPTYDASGKINGAVAVVRDITDVKRAEKENQNRAVEIELQQRLLEQREQERLQIARDLHDGPVQALTGITFTLRGVQLDTCIPEISQQLEAIQTDLQEQIGELRAYAGELRPPALSRFGLGMAIRSHLESFQQKHPEIQATFQETPSADGLTEEIRLGVFRIYQEALTNVAKHAQAMQVAIRLVITPLQLLLEVSDNGVGFEIPQDWLELARHHHLGLVGMRERALAIAGQMEIRSRRDAGTTVEVKVPLGERPKEI